MSKKDYDVGYGKPPVAGQFKKGASGNPKGRPKKENNLESVLDKALNETVVMKQGGKKRRFTKLEVAIMQQVNKAASGDAKAFQYVSKLLMQVNARQLIEKEKEPLPWTDDD